MNPIINPIWFYICSVVDAFKQGFALQVLSLFALLLYWGYSVHWFLMT